MDFERWKQVDSLLQSVLERQPEEREAFLRQACADDSSLEGEVRSLLALERKAGSFLQTPVMEAAGKEAPLTSGSLAGKTISHYRVIEKLGDGGMGTVWKVRDTRLDRYVALKLLHTITTSDPERKRRFIQEARAASALNHPNIVTIHDIEQADGADFIAMEFVPGKALDQLISRKRMRLKEAIDYAVQVADALVAAHGAGIVHRDLKPANIMATESGCVKVLDFGLAKLTEKGASENAGSVTSEPFGTDEGMILGTVSYMSPEQAEGKKVDARSDIFSFGAVLYEMITGRRAFPGDSTASILSAVLRDDPQPASEIVNGLPPELDRIIARCLRKDLSRRYQHAGDLRIDLEQARESLSASELADAGSRRKWQGWWLAAGALGSAAVVLLGAGLWFIRRPASPLPQQILAPVTTYPGSEINPSFSPDGRQIAFFWDGENGVNPGIYVKLLGETNPLRLTTGPDRCPAWAPDGRRIAFVRRRPNSGIYTVSALGGAERKLSGLTPMSQMGPSKFIAEELQMSWSPDGKWLSVALKDERNRGIFLLPIQGGEPRRISIAKPPAFDQCPAFAPDGRRLAYAGCTSEFSCDAYVQELDSTYSPRGSPRPITRQGGFIGSLTWSRNGGSLIYEASQLAAILPYLWRVGIDGRRAPRRLEIAGPMAYSPTVSPTANRLVFSRLLRDYDIWRYRVGDGMEPLIVSSLADYNPQFSPDGTRIAFESSRSGEAEEIWVAQADGSKPVQMTNLVGRHQGTPRWSPDGRWIAFDSEGQDGHWDIYAIEATGGLPRRVTSEPSDENMPFWSRDGKWIYFRSDRTGGLEIWRVPFAGGRPQQVTTRGGYVAYESADGVMLFYTKVDSGPLFARRLSGGEEHEVLPYINYKSFLPVPDGIYYIGGRSDEGYYPLEFFQFSNSASRLLAKIEGRAYSGLSVSPDRKTILFSKSISFGADLMMIENFQ